MRSTLLRRFLIIMIIVMLVGASLILAGNIIVSKDVHVDNEMSELIPKATAVKNMLSEYMAGNITREAFERLSKTIVETTCATTVLLSRDGEISYMYDYDTGLTSEDIERDLSSAIKQTMEGQRPYGEVWRPASGVDARTEQYRWCRRRRVARKITQLGEHYHISYEYDAHMAFAHRCSPIGTARHMEGECYCRAVEKYGRYGYGHG